MSQAPSSTITSFSASPYRRLQFREGPSPGSLRAPGTLLGVAGKGLGEWTPASTSAGLKVRVPCSSLVGDERNKRPVLGRPSLTPRGKTNDKRKIIGWIVGCSHPLTLKPGFQSCKIHFMGTSAVPRGGSRVFAMDARRRRFVKRFLIGLPRGAWGRFDVLVPREQVLLKFFVKTIRDLPLKYVSQR